jgi:hypothetical protein
MDEYCYADDEMIDEIYKLADTIEDQAKLVKADELLLEAVHGNLKTPDSEKVRRNGHTIEFVGSGGLAHCSVCGCTEGEMPTECPGYRVSPVLRREVSAGKSDFIDGEWVAITSEKAMNESTTKIVSMLMAAREFCTDVDCRKGFMESTRGDGLGKLASHMLFDRAERGLDEMRDALDCAIRSICESNK